jgi:hypothetical protein
LQKQIPKFNNEKLLSKGTRMAERWFVYQDAAGSWKWARLDVLGNVLASSDTSFESREACVEHARQSGYDASRQPELGPALRPQPTSYTSIIRSERFT